MTSGLAARAHLVLEEWQKLPLHRQQSFLVSLCDEISEARVAFELDCHIAVLRHLYDLRVKNVRRVFGTSDLDKRTLTICATRMGDIAEPSAMFAEHAHCLKIEAAVKHAIYIEQ